MSSDQKNTCGLLFKSDDQLIQCVDDKGVCVWKVTTPEVVEWNAHCPGAPVLTQESLSRGRFQYENGMTEAHFIMVFQPYGGLDWNIYYDKETGHIKRITEAR